MLIALAGLDKKSSKDSNGESLLSLDLLSLDRGSLDLAVEFRELQVRAHGSKQSIEKKVGNWTYLDVSVPRSSTKNESILTLEQFSLNLIDATCWLFSLQTLGFKLVLKDREWGSGSKCELYPVSSSSLSRHKSIAVVSELPSEDEDEICPLRSI
jgi:hypothetical protein